MKEPYFKLILLLLLSPLLANAQSGSKAFVDMNRIYSEYEPLQKATLKMKDNLSKLQEILDQEIQKEDSLWQVNNPGAINRSYNDNDKERLARVKKAIEKYHDEIEPYKKKIASIIDKLKAEFGYDKVQFKNGNEEVPNDITSVILERLDQ